MWFFYSPILCFGEGALDQLENIAGDKCFIVTDPDLVNLGAVQILTDKLDKFKKQYDIFADVEPDPSEETCLKAAAQCQAYEPNLIIGFGGGSSMDTAKAVWALYERPELGIDDLHPFMKLNVGQKAKLIAIPTTSGTGAETTWAVVITRHKANGITQKLEQTNKELIPTWAIIDPIFPKGMPPKLTYATGFDALGHSIEGLLATWMNDFSDGMSHIAIRMIFQYLPRVVADGGDLEAREKMHNAATMAGLAFGNSQAIIGHSMAHVLGAFFHVTHGIGVCLALPYIMQFCINDQNNPACVKAAEKLALVSKMMGWASFDADNMSAATVLIDKVKELQAQVGAPHAISELGLDQDEFEAQVPTMADQCMESSCSVMSPRAAGSEEFKKLYMYAWEGKDVDF